MRFAVLQAIKGAIERAIEGAIKIVQCFTLAGISA